MADDEQSTSGSAFLLPGALSAAQVTSIADSVAAQRRSIEALKAQLSAFDEQLAVLEQILGPFAERSRQLVTMRRGPETEGCLPLLPHTGRYCSIEGGAFSHEYTV